MKIKLRALWKPDVCPIIKSCEPLASSIKFDAIVHDFDVDTEIFEYYLDATKKSSGTWFHPLMEFESQEVDTSQYYQVDCRGKLLSETKNDHEFNKKSLQSCQLVETDAKTKIRLIDKISISKIQIKPNEIACASEWISEFVLPNKIVQCFKESSLNGFEIKPILDLKNNVYHENYFQLYTRNILKKAEVDITTIRGNIKTGPFSYRELGCITYDMKVTEFSDFNRTAENFGHNNCPVWIISTKVKQCYKDNKMKGWHFRPILDIDSSLYKTYIAKWEDVFRRVSINPLNKID